MKRPLVTAIVGCLLAHPVKGLAASSTSTPIPPPPPISVPVWSLACDGSPRQHTSMNIVTFATPVSVQPKLWAVSLYHGTKTKDTFLQCKQGVLQLLSQDHKHLVPVLGKHTGYDTSYSKQDECTRLGYAWICRGGSSLDASNIPKDGQPADTEIQSASQVLPQCPLYIQLKLESVMEDAGDHVVAICSVSKTSRWNEELQRVEALTVEDATSPLDSGSEYGNVLYSGQLRKDGII